MENSVDVNKDVNIVAYYFHSRGNRLKCFPKKMEYGGKSVIFVEEGQHRPVKKGQRLVHVFDMTDGKVSYRLEFDAQSLSWTLVSVVDMLKDLPSNLANRKVRSASLVRG